MNNFDNFCLPKNELNNEYSIYHFNKSVFLSINLLFCSSQTTEQVFYFYLLTILTFLLFTAQNKEREKRRKSDKTAE